MSDTNVLDDFVDCFRAGARHQREETDRFHRVTYEELLLRDKVSRRRLIPAMS